MRVFIKKKKYEKSKERFGSVGGGDEIHGLLWNALNYVVDCPVIRRRCDSARRPCQHDCHALKHHNGEHARSDAVTMCGRGAENSVVGGREACQVCAEPLFLKTNILFEVENVPVSCHDLRMVQVILFMPVRLCTPREASKRRKKLAALRSRHTQRQCPIRLLRPEIPQ